MSIRTDDLGFVFYEADEQEEKELALLSRKSG